MDRKTLSFLFLIVVLAAALRFFYLAFNPPSLNWDEVSHGYNAYSILKTGMDQWGQKFPIFNFRAYGDYPTTLNLYLTIPFIIIFGLTEFAVRFPHALLGTLTVISVYFFVWGIFRKKNLSLLAALLVAIGPWYLFTSRFVLQSNLSVFLLATSAALFFNREKRKYFLPLSMTLFSLTLFSYHTTRIFSPLLLLGSVIIFRDEIKNKLVYIFAAIFLILSAYILISPNATARGNLLFIIDQSAVNKIIEARNSSKLPLSLAKLVYNRPVYFLGQFSKNYISYFTPQFLFLKGGTQYQFSVPGKGLIYPVSLPFFYIGLILLVAKALKDKDYRLLLLWLILSPIPASLTNESFAVIRATTMLPIPEILIALGLYWLIEKSGKYGSLVGTAFFILTYILMENYLMNYFFTYRTNYSWSWQYGYKEVVAYAQANYSRYDKIIVTKKYGEPHEYFLFFMKYDPAKYQLAPNAIRFFQSNWYWVDRFDKFYFVNDWQVKDLITESKVKIDCSKIKCLLITSPNNAPVGWKKLDSFNFLNNIPAFEIYNNLIQ